LQRSWHNRLGYRDQRVTVFDGHLLAGSAPRIFIERRFESYAEPLTWTVWPFSRSAGWLDKVEGVASALDVLEAGTSTAWRPRSALRTTAVKLFNAMPFPPAPRLPPLRIGEQPGA